MAYPSKTINVIPHALRFKIASSWNIHQYPRSRNGIYWDRQAWVNSVDQDHMQQNVASDQALQCVPQVQQWIIIFFFF